MQNITTRLQAAGSPNSHTDHEALIGEQVLRIQYQKEVSQSHVTVQTKFNYAWGLVKSPVREHQVEGVQLLQGKFINISLDIISFQCGSETSADVHHGWLI